MKKCKEKTKKRESSTTATEDQFSIRQNKTTLSFRSRSLICNKWSETFFPSGCKNVNENPADNWFCRSERMDNWSIIVETLIYVLELMCEFGRFFGVWSWNGDIGGAEWEPLRLEDSSGQACTGGTVADVGGPFKDGEIPRRQHATPIPFRPGNTIPPRGRRRIPSVRFYTSRCLPAGSTSHATRIPFPTAPFTRSGGFLARNRRAAPSISRSRTDPSESIGSPKFEGSHNFSIIFDSDVTPSTPGSAV